MEMEFLRGTPEAREPFLRLVEEVQDDAERARRVIALDGPELFIARAGDALVGGVLCSAIEVKGRRMGVIEALVVAPDYLGRGTARRLMAMAESHCRALALAGVQVTVRADNAPARALYDSLGYHPVERRVRMWKEFARDAVGDSAARNVQVVVRWTEEVWNGGNLEAVAELVADPCLRHDPGKPAGYISVAENRERIAAFRAEIPDLHFTNDDLMADGDRVVARFTMTGTEPGAPGPFSLTGMEIFRLHEGKIAETWSSETSAGT